MITILKNRWNWFLLSGLVIFSGMILVIMAPGCKKKKEPVKIGLLTTLTGTASTSGIHYRNAGMLAVKQINKSGGINGHSIKLIVRDDKGDPEEALRVARVFNGLIDDIIIDKYGDPVRPMYIQEIQDSKIKNVGKFETSGQGN